MLHETKPRISRLMGVVPGLMFFPTEQELVGDYLYKKMTGNLTPEQCFFVRDFDLYGKEEPWQVWDRFEGQNLNEIKDLYFFTTLKKKSEKGSRIDRTVGSGGGTWLCKNSAESIPVHAEDGCCIVGSKKRFTYTNQSSDHNGCWIIHEYSLCPEHHPRNKNNNIVLCRLRKNQPAHAVAFGGNQEKGAKLKKRPAAKDKDYKEKSDKGTKKPPKKRELNNIKEETEQRIDDAQFQVCYPELIETPMYVEPSYLMIDKETSRVQENLAMQSTWMNSTATNGVLEEAAPKNSGLLVKESRFQQDVGVGAGMGTATFGYEDPIIDEVSISVPSNIDDLLSFLQSSNNLQTAADKSDFSRQPCLQHLYPETPEQDPVSPLDMALVPRLFAESPKDCHDNDYLMEEDSKDSFCQSLLQDMPPGVSNQGH